MAVEILARDLHKCIRQLSESDVAYDVNLRRVFLRSGLTQQDEVGTWSPLPGLCIRAARRPGPPGLGHRTPVASPCQSRLPFLPPRYGVRQAH